MKNKKLGILINYGLMTDEIFSTMKEKSQFMSHIFQNSPELSSDADLVAIAREFEKFCESFKRFSDTVETISELAMLKHE